MIRSKEESAEQGGGESWDDDDKATPQTAKKTLQDHSPSEYAFVVIVGLCMAFAAGYSNGVALSGFIHVGDTAVRQSVTGVTGAYTASAIAVGELNIHKYGFMVGTLFSVMAGSCISAVLNPCPVAFELSPRFGLTFVIGSIFAALGAFDGVHNNRREFYFTAIGNGIMNGVSSMYSANLIRTTHLTGTTTDIGLFIGQWIRGNRSNNWKLYILSGLATSFWIGSLSGYEASKYWRQHSLIFNATFFFAIGCSIIIYFVIVHKLSIFDAIFGLGKFGVKFEKITVTHKNVGGDEVGGRKVVSEAELMSIFDELDVNHEGHIDQDQLVDLLASRDLEVRTQRKPIIGILHTAFEEHDTDGDWKVSREDWRRLVHEQGRMRSLPPSFAPSGSISNTTAGDGGALTEIASLRNSSIRQIESSGFRLKSKDE